MKTKILVVLSMMLALVASAQAPDLEQLQNTVKALQQMVTNLQQEVIELKKQRAPSAAPTNEIAGQEKSAVEFIPPTIKTPPKASEVTPRDTINDYQEAAQRPGSLTLDPKYKGFIPIPNTPAFIKFNAKVRVDSTYDNQNTGNDDRFTPALIPVKGQANQGGGAQFNMNSRGSSLSLDVRAPDVPGDPRFYYNNDFFGGGVNSGMNYRVKHLYGQFYNITAGFTYSVFEDPDVWPDTVDFEGPNSMIFGRQPTVRYLVQLNEHWQMNFGIQQPASEVDNTGLADVSSVDHAPDGGFNVRWEDSKVGHVQFATILRAVGADSDTLGNDTVFGWGLMTSAGLNVFKRDSIQAQVTYGEGYFHFVNDNFTYDGFNGGDAAYDSHGHLQALPYWSAMTGYTHHWTDQFRSTASFGFVNLDNASSEGPLAYHNTYYSSANLVYQIRKRLSIGLEGLYGRKEVKNGETGDVFRVQVGLSFSLFD
jgi:hypothetical protein